MLKTHPITNFDIFFYKYEKILNKHIQEYTRSDWDMIYFEHTGKTCTSVANGNSIKHMAPEKESDEITKYRKKFFDENKTIIIKKINDSIETYNQKLIDILKLISEQIKSDNPTINMEESNKCMIDILVNVIPITKNSYITMFMKIYDTYINQIELYYNSNKSYQEKEKSFKTYTRLTTNNFNRMYDINMKKID